MTKDSSFSTSIRNLNKALSEISKSSEKLASGKRINRAADDAAGLAIAQQLTADAAVFKQASNNVNYGQSQIAIADGTLQQVSEIGTRLQELSTQAANGTLSDTQRSALNDEYQALSAEAQRIASSTEFNGQQLFSGSSTDLQVGLDASAESRITVPGTNLSDLLGSVSSKNISTQAGAQSALTAADNFVSSISSARGQLGAAASRLETADNNIKVATENLLSAEARIRDVDVAEESAKLVSAKIRSNASQASFAQSKLSAGRVLDLLK